jgi:hypothetical protein
MRSVNIIAISLSLLPFAFGGCSSSKSNNSPDAAKDAPSVDTKPAADSKPADKAVSDAPKPDAPQDVAAGPEALPRPDVSAPDTDRVEGGPAVTMSFFITSTGSGAAGGNLGGLTGADKKCQDLAMAVGLGNKTWHAYLSTSASGATAAVNAKDRIGAGPWYNYLGIQIASSVADLHAGADVGAPYLNTETALDEKGARVPGRGSANPPGNQHDMLTGSQLDGTAFPASPDRTCAGWTSTAAVPDAGATDASGPDGGVETPTAQVGHFDRIGTGAPNHQSWNSAHATPACSEAAIKQVGGAGRFYCFAIN